MRNHFIGLTALSLVTLAACQPQYTTDEHLDAALNAVRAGDYAFSYDICAPRAEEGLARAQTCMGLLAEMGYRDMTPEMAKGWYDKAAAQGDMNATYQLAILALPPKSQKPDYKAAKSLLDTAAERGHADAALQLAMMYRSGMGVEVDAEKAKNWVMRAAEFGNPSAQLMVGKAYLTGAGYEKSDAHGLAWVQKAADLSYPPALSFLGGLYESGTGVTASLTKAMPLYEQAAKGGDLMAQKRLGAIYFQGEGVTKSETKALPFIEQAAKQGDAESQYNLARFYQQGFGGIEVSPETAFKWDSASAAQNYVPAIVSVASAMLKGEGTEPNFGRAVQLLQAASAAGSKSADFNLGVLYTDGPDGFKNKERAIFFYQRAAAAGNATAKQRLLDLSKQ